MESVPMSLLPSRVPDPAFRAANRYDPFYDYVWTRRSVAQWREASQIRARRRVGLGRESAWFVTEEMSREAELQSVLSPTWRRARLGVLGCVHGWRTLTIQQAQAILGVPQLVSRNMALLRDLYAMGAVDVGHAGGFYDVPLVSDTPGEWLLRPSRSNTVAQRLFPYFTFPEQVRVSGGRHWVTGGQYDRHNVMAVEFALRVAEFTNAAAVFGESWSQAREVLFEGWGRQFPFAGGEYGRGALQNRGDGVLVREDGLRVVLEVQASARMDQLVVKVGKWARQLAVSPLSMQGTVVLFVALGDQSSKTETSITLVRQIRRAIQQALSEFPGAGANRVADRLFAVEWEELFPARHEAVADIAALPVWGPSGFGRMVPPEEVWRRVRLFDPAEVSYVPDGGCDPLAVARNAGVLFASPYWLRRADTPQLAGDAARVLWPAGVPGRDGWRGGRGGGAIPDRLLT